MNVSTEIKLSFGKQTEATSGDFLTFPSISSSLFLSASSALFCGSIGGVCVHCAEEGRAGKDAAALCVRCPRALPSTGPPLSGFGPKVSSEEPGPRAGPRVL